MLRITAPQKDSLREDLEARLIQRISRVIRVEHPAQSTGFSDEELRTAVGGAIERARSYGLHLDDDMFIFSRLTFVVGAHFDQYDFFQEILTDETISPDVRLARMIELATPEDWEEAALIIEDPTPEEAAQ